MSATPDVWRRAAAMRAEGTPVTDIAAAFRVSTSAVYEWLRKARWQLGERS